MHFLAILSVKKKFVPRSVKHISPKNSWWKMPPKNATKIEKEVRMTKVQNIQPKLDLAAVEAFATEELTHFLTGESNSPADLNDNKLASCARFTDQELNMTQDWFAINFGARCKDLGFEMDCGDKFVAQYAHPGCSPFSNAKDLQKVIAEVDDLKVLGVAIFSQWRYLTHWNTCGDALDVKLWFVTALKRLAELAAKGTTTDCSHGQARGVLIEV